MICEKGLTASESSIESGQPSQSANCRGGLLLSKSALGFDPRPLQTKVIKSGGSDFPLALRIMRMALRLSRQCQDNIMVKHWLNIVQETWICELSPLNN